MCQPVEVDFTNQTLYFVPFFWIGRNAHTVQSRLSGLLLSETPD